jgi:FKBP-type peptidyl-prolyl cis-trans isomerase SlyD
MARVQIAKDCVVTLQFTLSNEFGRVVESTPDGQPLVYVHGSAGVPPILGRELTGKVAGDRFDLTFTPEQGFGERQSSLIDVIPRAYFQNGGTPAIGTPVIRRDDSGGQAEYLVTAVDTDTITVDANHPFAGMTLRFQGVVLAVREARADELAQR